MVSLPGAMHSTFTFVVSVYIILWNSLKAIVTTICGVIYASKVYPPASKFIVSCAKTAGALEELRARPSDGKPRTSVSTVLEEFWTPDSVLESLGLLSIAIPVVVAVLGSTSCVLLATLVVTVATFVCGVLALPLAVCCVFGYSVGSAVCPLYGRAWGLLSARVSWVRSVVGDVFRSSKTDTNPIGNVFLGFKSTTHRKDMDGSRDGGKGTPDEIKVSSGSPKISATVESNEQSTNSVT